MHFDEMATVWKLSSNTFCAQACGTVFSTGQLASMVAGTDLATGYGAFSMKWLHVAWKRDKVITFLDAFEDRLCTILDTFMAKFPLFMLTGRHLNTHSLHTWLTFLVAFQRTRMPFRTLELAGTSTVDFRWVFVARHCLLMTTLRHQFRNRGFTTATWFLSMANLLAGVVLRALSVAHFLALVFRVF